MTLEDIIKALQTAVANANVYHGENTKEAYYAIEAVVGVAENLADILVEKDANFDVEAFLAEATKPKIHTAS